MFERIAFGAIVGIFAGLGFAQPHALGQQFSPVNHRTSPMLRGCPPNASRFSCPPIYCPPTGQPSPPAGSPQGVQTQTPGNTGSSGAPVVPQGNASSTDPNFDLPPAPIPQAANSVSRDFFTGEQAPAQSLALAPNMIGDFFGGGGASISIRDTREFSSHAQGFITNGAPAGATNMALAFRVAGLGPPSDAFSTGLGTDGAGNDSQADTFGILEPVFPTNLDTAPGPGFLYDGGTAVYTGSNAVTTAQPGTHSDGDFWFLQYSFTNTIYDSTGPADPPVVIAGPDVASRRVKISEGFSPAIRDRLIMNYSFFNDVQAGLGDISRWMLGFEKSYLNGYASLEVRVPLAATLANRQNIAGPEDRAFELGNVSLINKFLLLQSQYTLWSAGLGVTVPLADDSRLYSGNDLLLEVKNDSVHLLPFTGVLLELTDRLFLQGFTQLDIDANGDRVRGDARGGSSLPQIGRFTDATLLYTDVSLNYLFYRQRSCANRGLSAAFATSELHYTTSLQDADVISGNGVTYSSFQSELNILNATFGTQLLFCNNKLSVSPAMSIPLREGLDEQFDYEAILQVNYFF